MNDVRVFSETEDVRICEVYFYLLKLFFPAAT